MNTFEYIFENSRYLLLHLGEQFIQSLCRRHVAVQQEGVQVWREALHLLHEQVM